jgi:uncharacterized membrane protein YfcA
VPEWQKTVIAVGLGFLLGVVSGVLGAGGGVMVLLASIFHEGLAARPKVPKPAPSHHIA